jgi:hypothetical protein
MTGLGQPFYSTSLFVPTIGRRIQHNGLESQSSNTISSGLGFTNSQANLLSAAPFGLGTIVTLLVAIITDKYAVRGPVIIVL